MSFSSRLFINFKNHVRVHKVSHNVQSENKKFVHRLTNFMFLYQEEILCSSLVKNINVNWISNVWFLISILWHSGNLRITYTNKGLGTVILNNAKQNTNISLFASNICHNFCTSFIKVLDLPYDKKVYIL